MRTTLPFDATSRGLLRAAETGERVILRFVTPGDRSEFLRVRSENRRFLEPWEATVPNGADPFSPSSFERLLETTRTDRAQRFLICLRETGELIGQVSLGEIVRGALDSCYTGYWIAEAHTRKGLMSEALGLTVKHAFTTLKLHRIEANIMPHNGPSRALVRRAGFRLEGVARRYLRIGGRFRDHERWATTAEEWRRRPRGDGAPDEDDDVA